MTDPYGAVVPYDNGDSLDLVGFNGGTAYITAYFGYEQYYWDEFTESCTDEGWDDSGSVDGQAHTITVTSITPGRGVVSATTQVTLTGTNFTSAASINLGGSGITVSNKTFNSSTSITADFVVAANAAGGNHSVSVTVNVKTSNSKNFYVQVRLNFCRTITRLHRTE